MPAKATSFTTPITSYQLFREVLSQDIPRLAGLWLLGVLAMGLALVTPKVVGDMTNLFAGQLVSWTPLLTAVLALVAAQLGQSLVGYLQERTNVRLEENICHTLSFGTLARVLRFSADFFRDNEVERVTERVVEESRGVVRFYFNTMIGVPITAVSVLVFGGYMLLNNWFLGACIIVLSLMQSYYVLFDRKIQAVMLRDRETWDQVRVEASEAIASVAELRNHCAFDYGLGRFKRALEQSRQVVREMSRLQALFSAMGPLLGSLQAAALYGVGAVLCMHSSALSRWAGPMRWGDVIMFMMVAALFQGPVQKLASFFLQWRMSQQPIKRLDAYLERPCVFAEQAAPPASAEGAGDIALERVEVTAGSGAKILREVDLEVSEGEHVALAGPAGCGKSTLLNLLTRETEPSGGRVTLGAREVSEVDVAALARAVGHVVQRPVILNASIRDNLLLGLRRPAREVLHDDGGPIDLGPLPGVQSIAELERRLVAVLRLVSLEDDVLRKFLDSPPPAGAASSWRRQTPALRRVLRERLAGDAAQLSPFSREERFAGTVGENLFGPGACGGAALAPAATALRSALAGQALCDELLALGYRLLASEQAMAARTVRRAPALLQYLPARQQLGDAVQLPPEVDTARLRELSPELQETLLEIALERDLDAAVALPGQQQLLSHVLDARRRIAAAAEQLSSWERLDEGAAVFWERLPMRDNLLGGRVPPGVRGAAARVDATIEGLLAERGLLEPAISAGLAFQVGQGGKLLSGGQRQKVALARVLLKDPRVLLLDEATASLDKISQDRIVEMLRQRFRNKTVIAISHRLSTVRDYDRVVVLDRGQIVQQGTYEQLAAQDGIFRGLVGQQRREDDERLPDSATSPAERAIAGAEVQRQLALCPLFAHMDSQQLAFLQRIARPLRCDAGDALYRPGDHGDELYVVLRGEVELFVAGGEGEHGGEDVVATRGEGQSFGELAIFGDGLRTVGARARTALSLCAIEREALLELIAADAQIAVALLRGLAQRLSRASPTRP